MDLIEYKDHPTLWHTIRVLYSHRYVLGQITCHITKQVCPYLRLKSLQGCLYCCILIIRVFVCMRVRVCISLHLCVSVQGCHLWVDACRGWKRVLESPGAGVLSGCEESKVGWEPKLRFSARTANACICWKNQALESQPFYVMIPLAIKEPMFIQEWSRVCIISFLERKTALLSGSHFACLAKHFCNCGWSSVSVLHTAGLRLTAAFQLPSQAVGPSFCSPDLPISSPA